VPQNLLLAPRQEKRHPKRQKTKLTEASDKETTVTATGRFKQQIWRDIGHLFRENEPMLVD